MLVQKVLPRMPARLDTPHPPDGVHTSNSFWPRATPHPVTLVCLERERNESEQRESCVLAMPLSDNHLAVPKAFSIGVCFSLFPVLTCSHFHKSRQIKSPFKANYVESLKLFLGHFSICAVSFLGSLLDLCVQHRFKIMNAKQNRAPFTRKMHTS